MTRLRFLDIPIFLDLPDRAINSRKRPYWRIFKETSRRACGHGNCQNYPGRCSSSRNSLVLPIKRWITTGGAAPLS